MPVSGPILSPILAEMHLTFELTRARSEKYYSYVINLAGKYTRRCGKSGRLSSSTTAAFQEFGIVNGMLPMILLSCGS